MKELLRIMDGDMQIQSQRGKGTTVMIQIPQRKINEDLINGVDLPGEAVGKASREQSPDARLSAPDARILVVDDNRMNLQVMERLLKQYDVQVVTAASGKESLERIADGGFDLVFMDHMMPEMDGVETLHAIRQMPGEYFKQVPIVALTANTVTGAREALLAEGFDDFVDKPIRSQRLDSLLQQYLPTEKKEYASHPEARQAETPAVDKSVSDRLLSGAGNGITPNSTKKLSDLKFLNVELACTYCESEQVYRDVLKDYGKRGEKNWSRLESLYAAEDWKNYTIEVHGIKSSMLAIGAQSLSAKAKELETAGRQGDITFIREHHDAMLKEFKEVITSIQAFFGMAVETKKPAQVVERTVSLPELSDEMITTFLQKMEKATYDFDELEMKSCVMQLRGYAHKGHSLDETITEVVRKIEMADYMSAYDCLVHQLTDA
jgi:CheY-like chemotaxis protein/HPt (histidine-containing phosphotransfer) domain-containing protein